MCAIPKRSVNASPRNGIFQTESSPSTTPRRAAVFYPTNVISSRSPPQAQVNSLAMFFPKTIPRRSPLNTLYSAQNLQLNPLHDSDKDATRWGAQHAPQGHKPPTGLQEGLRPSEGRRRRNNCDTCANTCP